MKEISYFQKSKSVFKDYIDDNEENIKKACEKDFFFSKAQELYKDNLEVLEKLKDEFAKKRAQKSKETNKKIELHAILQSVNN